MGAAAAWGTETCSPCPSWQGVSQPGHSVVTPRLASLEKDPCSSRVPPHKGTMSVLVKGQEQAQLCGGTEGYLWPLLAAAGEHGELGGASAATSSCPIRATGLIVGMCCNCYANWDKLKYALGEGHGVDLDGEIAALVLAPLPAVQP